VCTVSQILFFHNISGEVLFYLLMETATVKELQFYLNEMQVIPNRKITFRPLR